MQAEFTLADARKEIDSILTGLAAALPQCKDEALSLLDRLIDSAEGKCTSGALLLACLALAVETMAEVERGAACHENN